MSATIQTVGGELPDVVRKYFDCANNREWDPFPQLWDDHAEVSLPGMGTKVGRDEIVAHYKKLFAGFSEHHDRITRAIVAEDSVVLELRFEGRTTGDREVAFDAVDVIDLRDGRIGRLRGWFDTAEVNRLLTGGSASG